MRILTVGNRYPPWSLGGYEVVWAESARALREAGHTVRVLTTRPDPTDLPAPDPPPKDVHRELGWYWRDHKFPRRSLVAVAALERSNARILSAHLDSFSPEAVMWWAMGGMSLSLIERVRLARLPALGVVGDDWMTYGPRVDGWTRRWRGPRRVLAPLARALVGVPACPDLDGAGLWLFNSQHLVNSARQAGWELSRVEILPPGVDPDRFPLTAPRPWGWRLLYCGRLDPRKGVATAIKALASLPGEATLRIHGAGESAYVDELRRMARRLDLAERIVFTSGPHDTVAGVYAEADAVVFPVTWQEPWGLVPLEAMSVGRPVLASRAGGGPAEYLEAGRNCLQFAPGDHRALAAVVATLAGDEALRGRLVQEGARTASRFTQRRFLDGIEDATLRAVAGHRSGRGEATPALEPR